MLTLDGKLSVSVPRMRRRVREIVAPFDRASYGRTPPPNAEVNVELGPKDEFLRPLSVRP